MYTSLDSRDENKHKNWYTKMFEAYLLSYKQFNFMLNEI